MRHTTSWQRVNWILLALILGATVLFCAPTAGGTLPPAATTQAAGMPTFKAAANAPTDGELSSAAEASAESGHKRSEERRVG